MSCWCATEALADVNRLRMCEKVALSECVRNERLNRSDHGQAFSIWTAAKGVHYYTLQPLTVKCYNLYTCMFLSLHFLYFFCTPTSRPKQMSALSSLNLLQVSSCMGVLTTVAPCCFGGSAGCPLIVQRSFETPWVAIQHYMNKS